MENGHCEESMENGHCEEIVEGGVVMSVNCNGIRLLDAPKDVAAVLPTR